MEHASVDENNISLYDYKPFGAKLDQIRSLLQGPVTEDTADAVSIVLCEYQEIPELLDPYLQTLTYMIVEVIRSDGLAAGSSMLYTLCKVRGAATVVRLLPHAVTDFKFVLSIFRRDSNFSWQTRYTLLTWMGMLVMVPFSLETIVSSNCGNVIDDLMQMFLSYITHTAPTSIACAGAIAKLLSRNDATDEAFQRFIQWCRKKLPLNPQSAEDLNCMIGVFNSFIQLLKTISRERMLPFLDQIMDLFPSDSAQSRSVVIRKLSLKLLQRIGMSYLPSEAALWRYKMGKRSLLLNLQPGTGGSEPVLSYDPPKPAQRSLDNVPWERLETILDGLLLGLCDSDTIVRWSAAKGLGRCTMRLDRTMADDVVSNIISMFSNHSVSMHLYWQGGLLALAEFCRRCILLPHRLEVVIPIVCQGLVFEESLGTHSVGSNVRDAACYVAWSFARAYSAKEMAPFAKDLSSGLIVTALFDREVNVRRAACAAFQENVGRHGLFPAGIACNTIADYFSVGIATHSYSHVANEIGKQHHYTEAMVSHLLSNKIRHWDYNLRRLACESLAMLCAFLPDFGFDRIMPELVAGSTSDVVSERHGAITALACLLKTFSKSGRSLTELKEDLQSSIRNLPPIIEKARLYRGRGGELVRSAVCELIFSLSLLRFPIKLKTIKRYQLTLEENLIHPSEKVREAAVACLAMFSEAYFDSLCETDLNEIIHRFALGLGSSPNVAATRGYALALGSLPIRFIQPRLGKIFSQLVIASQPVQSAERLDAETRLLSVQSLVSICCCLPFGQQCDLVDIPEDLVSSIDAQIEQIHTEPRDVFAQCIACLLLSLEDYATDKRGDIGSWVRMSAVKGLETVLLSRLATGGTKRGINSRVISAILKQSVEKLDKVRRVAGEVLSRLVFCELDLPLRSELRETFRPGVDWSAAAVTFPLITPLLRFPQYRDDLFSGLVISAGGLTATISRHAVQSLVSLLSPVDDETTSLARACLAIVIRHLSSKECDVRVILPAFNTLPHLLHCSAARACADESVINRIRTCVLRQCRISRLVTVRLKSIDVLCALLHFNSLGDHLARENFAALAATLQHKVPKVRKTCAEAFYSNLLVLESDSGLNPEEYDTVLDGLISTPWAASSDAPELFAALHFVPKTSNSVKTDPLKIHDAREFQYQDFIHDLDR